MKQIESVPIWNNGEIKSAEVLTSQVTGDDLIANATFYYRLLTTDLLELASGNLSMTGVDYDAYTSNEYAWGWIATKLGLVIVEEPTTTTTTIIENTTTTTTTENITTTTTEPVV